MQPVSWTTGGTLGDIDRAYDNLGAIPDARTYPPRWIAAAAFRSERRALARDRSAWSAREMSTAPA